LGKVILEVNIAVSFGCCQKNFGQRWLSRLAP